MMAAFDAMGSGEGVYAGDVQPPFDNLEQIIEHLANIDTKDTGTIVGTTAPATWAE
jgi:hypothetical protein